ncbi:hypothetical protein HW932_19125 [Allochromatium humboldtianum]|uniref:Uncharacterized protein n=1 Tax=Allochromatium humboldtianum TaxID=504901 RepID=A0A850RGQ3_9GAMM|nr:hypothetical protein [Allochromatium humboldtianum]NVZ11366.1 hypothetical protein [Allochromatium humboldtianum]
MTWTTTAPDAVRCADCRHWRGGHGWCRAAGKVSNSARAARRCKHFARTPTALDFALEAIEQAGLIDAVELIEVDRHRVAARLRPGLSAEIEAQVLDLIDSAMSRAAREVRG